MSGSAKVVAVAALNGIASRPRYVGRPACWVGCCVAISLARSCPSRPFGPQFPADSARAWSW
jgi:hypothetical protein